VREMKESRRAQFAWERETNHAHSCLAGLVFHIFRFSRSNWIRERESIEERGDKIETKLRRWSVPSFSGEWVVGAGGESNLESVQAENGTFTPTLPCQHVSRMKMTN
jgi:hypothetical protein